MQPQSSLLEKKQHLLMAIDGVLKSIIQETEHVKSKTNPFNSPSAPSISISAYFVRIATMAHCSPSIFVITLILMDKIQQIGQIIVTSRCIHRLLMICTVLAAKAYDDFYFKNTYYSKVAGISLQELNNLQLIALNILNFDISIQSEVFELYVERLQNFIDMYQKKK